MTTLPFIHLRIHSDYSLSDGIVRIKALVKAAAAAGMPALALTDHMNLFGCVKFYKAAIAQGIKPIIGVDVTVRDSAEAKKLSRLTLLAQNEQGYRNITQLISRAHLENHDPSGTPAVLKAWLLEKSAGIIVLSGGREGDVGQALLGQHEDTAKALLLQWAQAFPQRYYIELQRTGRPEEETYLQRAVKCAQELQLPVVATNDVRFLAADDFEAHEARVCIHSGHVLEDPKRPRHYSPQQYLRATAEMQALFADVPSALENAFLIAKRCNVELSLNQVFLPNFPIPGAMSPESYLQQQAETGLQARLTQLFAQQQEDTAEKITVYQQRLQTELKVINSMGFAGYFLIVADFIQWAKNQGIFVGPGRGSGAGSLVAYALKITDIDPLQYDLLFERFLNPERVSMPDFDIDFCILGRDRVIDYVARTYGRDSVSQIITYGTMAAKAVVRDVGRVLGYPYGFVDKIAKLVPFELGITLKKALEQEEELRLRYEQEEDVRTLIDLALKLEGMTRNAGKHAGGVVIAPSQITDFVPLYCEPGGTHPVTQFDKDDVEAVGLVKFDFLGLRNLTVIDWAVQMINQRRRGGHHEPLLDLNTIPLDDSKTFDLLKACATTAVFQLESRAMKDLIKRLQPDCFEDIIALVALIRPGPSGMVDDFIDRKHGRAQVEYLHPLLESSLRSTYGIILYQEQVMQIAQVLAGYTLGAADLLRRAMGKKKPEEMAKQRSIFLTGALAQGIAEATATQIFDLMEKFASYGFNKSHSAAYSLVSYQTAWLKAHYPAEFMAAVLSSDMHHTDKVVSFIEECKSMGLTILPPNINQGDYRFAVNSAGEIVYGLGAIKGVGESAIAAMVAERQQGLFSDLFDFCQRVDLRKLNRRTLEALIRSGALDSLGTHRAQVWVSLEAALQAAEQSAATTQGGQVDLFGLAAVATQVAPVQQAVKPWSLAELLQGEKETLGHYISGHPLQNYTQELHYFKTTPIAELTTNKNQTIMIAGIVVALRALFTKRGQKMAVMTLEDRTGRIEIAVFPEAYEAHKAVLSKDQILIVQGEVSIDEFTGSQRISARKLLSLEDARHQHAKQIVVSVAAQQLPDNFLMRLEGLLRPFQQGGCAVVILYQQPTASAEVLLGQQWRVRPEETLLQSLREFVGEEAVAVRY